MPLVHRFGISHMPVSREFAREWQFNGLATTRQTGLLPSGRQSTSCAASVDSTAFREPSGHTTRFDNCSTADGLSWPGNLWYINGSN